MAASTATQWTVPQREWEEFCKKSPIKQSLSFPRRVGKTAMDGKGQGKICQIAQGITRFVQAGASRIEGGWASTTFARAEKMGAVFGGVGKGAGLLGVLRDLDDAFDFGDPLSAASGWAGIASDVTGLATDIPAMIDAPLEPAIATPLGYASSGLGIFSTVTALAADVRDAIKSHREARALYGQADVRMGDYPGSGRAKKLAHQFDGLVRSINKRMQEGESGNYTCTLSQQEKETIERVMGQLQGERSELAEAISVHEQLLGNINEVAQGQARALDDLCRGVEGARGVWTEDQRVAYGRIKHALAEAGVQVNYAERGESFLNVLRQARLAEEKRKEKIISAASKIVGIATAILGLACVAALISTGAIVPLLGVLGFVGACLGLWSVYQRISHPKLNHGVQTPDQPPVLPVPVKAQ